MKGMMKVKLVIALLVVIAVAIFYYVSLPAINIHATETWKFIFLILAVLFVLYIVRKAKIAGQSKIELSFIKEYTGLKIGVIVFLLFLAVYVAGSILSSPIVNAAKYQKLLKVEEGEFTEDIKQISYDQIPLLDRDSASILGNRKMGSLVDMASQFEVSELYSQINYKGEPVRVTPLRYADTIKWLTNQKEGIPAYIKIDMATQDTELVRLSEGMKYTPIGISPEQAQFLETRKFQINEIARIFRVPPHMVGDLEKSSFSNIEQQSLEFVKYTLDPWVIRWEQSIQRSLLSKDEKSVYFVKFNLEGLLRGDYQSRMNGYAIGRQNGWMSANDIRELENLDRIPAEDGGDLYLINGNMLPLKNAGAFADTPTDDGKEEKSDEEVLELEEQNGNGGADAVPERNHRRRKLV